MEHNGSDPIFIFHIEPERLYAGIHNLAAVQYLLFIVSAGYQQRVLDDVQSDRAGEEDKAGVRVVPPAHVVHIRPRLVHFVHAYDGSKEEGIAWQEDREERLRHRTSL